MIVLQVRSNTGDWYDVYMPATREQVEQARAEYRRLVNDGHPIDQASPSRALARQAMDAAGIPPAPNGYEALMWGSAVMCSARFLKWGDSQ